MSDSKNTNVKSHDVVLNARGSLSINGVKEIVSFDETGVSLKTVCGDLSVDGEGIHVSVLNIEKGEIEMQGKINGLNYYDSNDSEKRTLLSRIFK